MAGLWLTVEELSAMFFRAKTGEDGSGFMAFSRAGRAVVRLLGNEVARGRGCDVVCLASARWCCGFPVACSGCVCGGKVNQHGSGIYGGGRGGLLDELEGDGGACLLGRVLRFEGRRFVASALCA